MAYIPRSQLEGAADRARQQEAETRRLWSESLPGTSAKRVGRGVRICLWIVGVIALTIGIVIAIMQLTL